MRQTITSICILVGIAGCAAPQPLVAKQSSDHRPTTSPAGIVRTDGMYVCRGLKGIGSAGGLGFWPFESPATQLSFVEFLRFDVSGKVSRWYTEEPKTDNDARLFFQDNLAGQWAVTGHFEMQGSHISFVLSGLTVDGYSHSTVPYAGEVYVGYLSASIDNGDIFPISSRYDYREYDFVPNPATRAGFAALRPERRT